MKKYLSIAFFCLLFSSCMAQKGLSSSDAQVLENVYQNQLAYYNSNIKDKDNYISIINFAKQERTYVIQRAEKIIQSKNFTIMEGFSPGWGNFIGLIWNDNAAYLYRRFSKDKRFSIVKVKLTDKDNGIDSFIIDKISRWDINYINNLKNRIGTSVLDGYNFIATKVSTDKTNPVPKLETIAFEQFAPEK